MNPGDFLKLDDNIRFRRVGDEGVVVDQRSAEIMVVSETAVRTLELIRDTHSLRAVQKAMFEEFDVTVERASEDLELFLSELRERNILLS